MSKCIVLLLDLKRCYDNIGCINTETYIAKNFGVQMHT